MDNVTDITGVVLTPGSSDLFLGNKEQGFGCCCDECTYFLRCFPQYAKESYYTDGMADIG